MSEQLLVRLTMKAEQLQRNALTLHIISFIIVFD